MKRMTGSQAVMESLLQEGVDIIFGYPGGAIMPVYDALYDYRDKIRHILVRHEQGAGHAAEGYARMTGEPGVALVTSGPGATNLVTAITDAMLDSVPVVIDITKNAQAEMMEFSYKKEPQIMGYQPNTMPNDRQIDLAAELLNKAERPFMLIGHGILIAKAEEEMKKLAEKMEMPVGST